MNVDCYVDTYRLSSILDDRRKGNGGRVPSFWAVFTVSWYEMRHVGIILWIIWVSVCFLCCLVCLYNLRSLHKLEQELRLRWITHHCWMASAYSTCTAISLSFQIHVFKSVPMFNKFNLSFNEHCVESLLFGAKVMFPIYAVILSKTSIKWS